MEEKCPKHGLNLIECKANNAMICPHSSCGYMSKYEIKDGFIISTVCMNIYLKTNNDNNNEIYKYDGKE